MNSAARNKLAARGLITSDSSGREAVRVYLQYLPPLSERSSSARGKALGERFELATRKRGAEYVELDPDSLSESGQMIEATVPVDKYEQIVRDLATEDLRVDVVQAFNVT